MCHPPQTTRHYLSDAVSLVFPPGAHLPSLALARQDGRDQTAQAIARDGWESFERPLPSTLYRAAQKWPGLFLDVGANTGLFTLIALAAHARNHVVAFEPLPDILEALNGNIYANQLQHRVRLIRCALSDSNGAAPLYVPSAEHGWIETSASLRADFKPSHSAVLEVLQRTLDRVLFRPSLAMKRVSVIKIDVEGHEARVLAGARWTIARHRPIVFVEVLRHADLAALSRFVDRHRYVDVRLRVDGPPPASSAVSFDDDALNHAFVPVEKLQDFLGCTR